MKVEALNRTHGLTLRINHGKEERILAAPQSVYQHPNACLPLFSGCFCGSLTSELDGSRTVMLDDGRWKMIWLEAGVGLGVSHLSCSGKSIQISIGCVSISLNHTGVFSDFQLHTKVGGSEQRGRNFCSEMNCVGNKQ